MKTKDGRPKFFLDTSFLRGVSWNNSDFRIFLEHSKKKKIVIFIPKIAWEERRAQFVDDVLSQKRRLEDRFSRINGVWSGSIIVQNLNPPALVVPSDDEIRASSIRELDEFAKIHKLQILPIGDDHRDRVWDRYFDRLGMFDEEKSESRRNNIPDAWILEAAIDISKKQSNVVCMCRDNGLSTALKSEGFQVIEKTEDALNIVAENLGNSGQVKPVSGTKKSASKSEEGVAHELSRTLVDADSDFRQLDLKILGFVGYLDGVSKQQIEELLIIDGAASEAVRNAAERLAIMGLIKDTGNNYLPQDQEICAQAAAEFEDAIIQLLEGQNNG
jgi:hypothetical protein